jgi:hypothetical protein
MSMLLVIAFACLASRIVPRLLAEVVVTIVGMVIVLAGRRARRMLLERACPVGAVGWDRKPTRAEARALRGGLNAALDMTVFTSLLPHVAIRAHKLAAF